jgi:hypothetical protein
MSIPMINVMVSKLLGNGQSREKKKGFHDDLVYSGNNSISEKKTVSGKVGTVRLNT